MIVLLLLVFGLTCVTVLIHALGTLLAIAHRARVSQQQKKHRRPLAAELHIVLVVSVLLLFHLAEAGVWAAVYWFGGLLPDMEKAIYFSITSYTTVGYGDVLLPADRRLLGPIEAAVGILMFGWSTAIIVAVLNRVYADRLRLSEDTQAESQ
jgi:voltage-gated potassium channel